MSISVFMLYGGRQEDGVQEIRNQGCFVGSLLTAACADDLQLLQIMSNFEFHQTRSLNIRHIDNDFSHIQIAFW